MTDHANELRRYSRKIGHPAGDVPSVMLAAADEIERLAARLEAAEKSDAESLTMYRKARDERDELRANIEEMERQEPLCWAQIDELEETVSGVLGFECPPYYTTPLYLASGAQPAPSFADAYQGAMEDVAIWKKRALEAEYLNRKFVAEINGPAYMGEPAHPKPDCGEAGHDEGRCGNAQCSSDAKGERK